MCSGFLQKGVISLTPWHFASGVRKLNLHCVFHILCTKSRLNFPRNKNQKTFSLTRAHMLMWDRIKWEMIWGGNVKNWCRLYFEKWVVSKWIPSQTHLFKNIWWDWKCLVQFWNFHQDLMFSHPQCQLFLSTLKSKMLFRFFLVIKCMKKGERISIRLTRYFKLATIFWCY